MIRLRDELWPLLALAGSSCLLVFQVVLLGKLPDHFDYWLQEYVYLGFLHNALQRGELPLWNPQLIAGTPHLADPQAAVLYPFTTLPLLIASPTVVARLTIPFHFFLAGLGLYGLARALGISRAGATAAGLVYALAPHFAPFENAGYIQQTSAWAPWIAWALLAAFQRGSLLLFALAGACWALQLFRGFAQNWYATGLFAGIWCLYLLAVHARRSRRPWRLALGVAVFAVAGLALGAAQLLPSFELLRESQRSGGFALAEASGPGRVTLFNLLGAAGPDEEVSGAFPGGTVVALAIAGLLGCGGRHRAFFALFGVVALALTLGNATPLWSLAYRVVPGFTTMHMPHRALFLWTLCLAVLAGMGVDALAHRPRTGRLQSLAPAYIALAAALWLAIAQGDAPAEARRGFVQLVAGMAAIVVVALAPWERWWGDGVDWWQRTTGRTRQTGTVSPAVVFPMLIGIDLLAFTLPRLHGAFYPPNAVYAPPPAVQWLTSQASAATSAGAGPFRFASEPYGADAPPDYGPKVQDNRRIAFLPPNVSALYPQLDAAQGYLPIRLGESGDYFNALNDLGRNARVLSVYDPSSRLFDLLNVRYFVTGPAPTYLSRAGGGLSLTSADGAKTVAVAEPRPARALEVWSSLGDSAALADGTPVALITVRDVAGAERQITLRAGDDTAEWLYDVPGVAGTVHHRMAPVARADPRAGGGHTYVYRTTFPLDAASSSSSAAGSAAQIAELRVQVLQPGIRLNVDRFLLQVPFASRFRLAYDASPVRIWENRAALPRAWWVGSYVVEPDSAAHLELLKSPGFDPRRQAVLYADPRLPPGSSASAPLVRVDAETANTVRLSLDAPADGLLVVSQTAAPGWRALVDGRPAPVLPADGILQAIPVTAGAHRVVLRYLPQSFVAGATISLVALALLAAWGAAWRLRRHRALSSRERITSSAGSGGRGSGLARATGDDTAA